VVESDDVKSICLFKPVPVLKTSENEQRANM